MYTYIHHTYSTHKFSISIHLRGCWPKLLISYFSPSSCDHTLHRESTWLHISDRHRHVQPQFCLATHIQTLKLLTFLCDKLILCPSLLSAATLSLISSSDPILSLDSQLILTSSFVPPIPLRHQCSAWQACALVPSLHKI